MPQPKYHANFAIGGTPVRRYNTAFPRLVADPFHAEFKARWSCARRMRKRGWNRESPLPDMGWVRNCIRRDGMHYFREDRMEKYAAAKKRAYAERRARKRAWPVVLAITDAWLASIDKWGKWA